MFRIAKRSVGNGIVASAVVCGWTNAVKLPSSSSLKYSYGQWSVLLWVAASVQIFVFAIGAIELKRLAADTHTFLDISKIRDGHAGH